MDHFSYDSSTRIHFGKKTLKELATELKGRKTVMLAYGCSSAKESGLHEQVSNLIENAGARIVDFGGIAPNPTWAKVEEGAELAKAEDVDFILGVGGGAVMDCAKAISLAARQDKAWKKHWVRDEQILVDPIPHGFVVTCAGSGSEGNGQAFILNEKTHVKAGNDYPELAADFAIIDPELTYSVPRDKTIAGAYETLSNLLEIYFSQSIGEVISDDLLEAAIRNVIRSLNTVLEKPDDYNARANLLWASSLTGNGMLKCGKDGIFQCRMMANQVSAYTGCPHAHALAAIQPKYYRFIKVTSVFVTYQLKRFATNLLGVDTSGKDNIDAAIEGVNRFEALTQSLGMPKTLGELGADSDLIRKIGQSTKIIPMTYCRLNNDDIEILLEQCL